MSAALLQTRPQVTIRFGGLTAVSNLDLCIGEKRTHRAHRSQWRWQNDRVQSFTHRRLSAHEWRDLFSWSAPDQTSQAASQLTKHGTRATFQNIRLFTSLTVFDNVRAATQLHRAHGIRDSIWRGKSFRHGEQKVEAQVMELLGIFGLEKFRDELATSLPYGEQRRLEIVRALATHPRLLLLDEAAVA